MGSGDSGSSHGHFLATLISGPLWVSVGSAGAEGNAFSVEAVDRSDQAHFLLCLVPVSFESLHPAPKVEKGTERLHAKGDVSVSLLFL